jgi:agmatine deiminase
MRKSRFAWASLSAALIVSTAVADKSWDAANLFDHPLDENGRPTYPEGFAVPRNATPAELALGPVRIDPLRGMGGPPTGPIHCVAEYEPMEGVLLAWEGSTAQLQIVQQMTARITNEGASKVYMVVDNSFDQMNAHSGLVSGGANMSRVEYVERVTDSIWIRDYGPRYIYEGDCRAIVDHTYNRPRPADNEFSVYFAEYKNHAYYSIPLVHGGGNYHLNDLNESAATRLIVNENPSLTEPQIIQLWQDYQGLTTTLHNPFPTSIDATQHIDMWMQIIGPRAIMISDWPFNAGSTQDIICDAAATLYANAGWTVHRLPARSLGGVHYTYTNVTMCNGIVLMPTYTQAMIVSAGHNAEALATWQAALPDKQIIEINCQGIVSLAGVMHCICMHVPVHRGGLNPTAYLKNLRGGESLNPNDIVNIRWISDDDVKVENVDILLSTDGGATWPITIASATEDDGVFTWIVPDIATTAARVRVVARDADGRTGFDASPANFTINGSAGALPGDMNCDGAVTVTDIGPFVLALTDPAGYAAQFPACNLNNGDINGDNAVTVTDIGPFVSLLTGG